jgi:Ca-activated chloride channel family protein
MYRDGAGVVPLSAETDIVMNSLELTQPVYLLLILPMLAVLIIWYQRSLSDLSRFQRLLSLTVRGLICLLLVLSLSGLTWLQTTREQFVMFVVDQSLSVNIEGVTAAAEYLDKAVRSQGSNQTGFLPFAAHPGDFRKSLSSLISKPGTVSRTDAADGLPAGSAEGVRDKDTAIVSRWLPENVPVDGTSLAEAIDAAAAMMPEGYVPHIVLLTDGNQTTGDAIASASRSRAAISTVPLPGRSNPEVQVSEVSVPGEVREGEPFFVEVTVFSNHDDEGILEVFRGDHRAISERRALKAGKNRFRFQQSIDRDRMAAFKVQVSGLQQDTLLDNNSETGLVYASGKPRVLIIESDPALIRELAYALEDEGIHVDVRPPQGIPDTLAGLQNYELVMLSNVPATAMTQRQMDLVRTYVQELGGGFIMLGGEQSFGLGGYYKSTLEEILPVRSDFEKEKEKPSLGMVLVIDRSGSMDGDKLEMAKSAAQAAVELLGNRDQIAVLAFDDQTCVVSEMQSAANKSRVTGDIARIESGGGTSMYPAMEMSFEILNSASARLKHVIMLTDGISNSGDFESMARQMVSAKMTVSTVAVGGDGSTDTELLESIARIGKGRYHLAEDPAQVPQIFAKETVTAGKSAIDEQPFVPQVVRATHALSQLDMESAPFLLGCVMTRPKPTCEVILATEKGDPLLAWWRYGLGMTAAFTSDAKSRWAAEWLTWPGYSKFWTQVVRHIMRKGDTRGIQVTTARHGRETELTVDAVDESGRFLNQSDVEVTMVDPELKRVQSKMSQTAPGRYAMRLNTPTSGAYHFEIALKQDGQVKYRKSRGVMVGYSDELRIRPTDEGLLKEIAAVSGGEFQPDPELLFDLREKTALRPKPLRSYLLTLVAFLMVLDVAIRRIDLTVLISNRITAE